MLEALARAVYSTLDRSRRRPLLAFLVLAFAFSWLDWGSILVTGARVVPGRLPTDMFGMAGPAFAAFVVIAIEGRETGMMELARRIMRVPWRSAWFWILAPGPLWVLLASLAVRSAAGLPVPPATAFARYPGLPPLPLPTVFDLVLLGAGFGQEIGWRGLALPRLQSRLGPLAGAMAVAVPWGVWLLPLLVVNPAWQAGTADAAQALAASALLLLASSVLLAFVVARTGGSLAAAALWHACLRMAMVTEAGRETTGLAMLMVALVGATVVAGAEVIARRRGGSILAVAPSRS